jgi:cobalt-zinc-cadmium efflux system protein
VALVAAQVVYGIQAGSIALITDAGHNLGDALGLLLAWGAYALARWEPTERCRGHGHAISTPAR